MEAVVSLLERCFAQGDEHALSAAVDDAQAFFSALPRKSVSAPPLSVLYHSPAYAKLVDTYFSNMRHGRSQGDEGTSGACVAYLVRSLACLRPGSGESRALQATVPLSEIVRTCHTK